MNKKGPPPGEQEKKKTTVKVNSRFTVSNLQRFKITVFKLLNSLGCVHPRTVISKDPCSVLFAKPFTKEKITDLYQCFLLGFLESQVAFHLSRSIIVFSRVLS